mgnify:CR=1 FL=1
MPDWRFFVQRYYDCPQILRDFLTYHETIKGQSQLTISEYYLDLRMFLRFMKLMNGEMPRTFAIVAAPSTNVSLDHASATRPTAMNTSESQSGISEYICFKGWCD